MKRNTLILLLIAAVAGVAVYFIEGKSGKPANEEAEKAPPAFKFSREDVTGISLVRGGQTINLENKDKKWVITQPVNAAADESAVDPIVGDLVTARVETEFPPSGGDLKQYGLSEPCGQTRSQTQKRLDASRRAWREGPDRPVGLRQNRRLAESGAHPGQSSERFG
jgi:hypothetical protein